MSIEQIASEALQLGLRERALLAETIWESIEDPYFAAADMLDDEAILLAKWRGAELESGKVNE